MLAWVRRDPHPTVTISRPRWLWFICRDGHCKMLCDHRPICPVCNWAMDELPLPQREPDPQQPIPFPQRAA